MKISDNNPAFNQATLLLVTSRQDASAYTVSDRNAEKLFSFHLDKPEYTDKEGGFDRSGKNGKRLGGGETDKQTESIVYTEFLEKLNEHLDQIPIDEIETVILFAPEHLANQTHSHLPANIKSKVTKTINGNLTNENLNDLVARIHRS